MKKTIAIVTGASSGFGKEFIWLLCEEELDEIWMVARSREKLEVIAKEYGEKLKVYPADLTDREEIKKFSSLLQEADVTVRYLINNAGFAKFCMYDEISLDESLNMVALNISGVVGMGLVCIPFMERGSHIINIASQASFQPLPGQNIYSSTKSFVRNYSRALNVELKERGIYVTAVCPGWMHTNLIANGTVETRGGTKNFKPIVSPDVVAKKALEDAKKGKDMSVYGTFVKFGHIVAKILPQKWMMKIWLMTQK